MAINFTQKLESAPDEYRKKFIRLIVAQEREVNKELSDFGGEVVALSHKGSEIRSEDEIQKGLKPVIKAFTAAYILTMLKFNQSAASVNGDKQVFDVSSRYSSLELESMVLQKSRNYADYLGKNLLTRAYPVGGVPIGEKITYFTVGAAKNINNIVALAIQNGKSAKELAAELDNYIINDAADKWVSPYQYYREKFGFKRRIPNGIPAGSVQYNTIRIARTEINNTWRQATLRIHKDSPWVKGFLWVLSGSHPITDVCDTWANEGPYEYNEITGFGHPYCLCHIEVDYKTYKELQDEGY